MFESIKLRNRLFGTEVFKGERGVKVLTSVLVVVIIAALVGAGIFLLGWEGIFDDSSSDSNQSGPMQRNVMLASSPAALDLGDTDNEKTSSLVEGANQFAFELFSQLAEENGNSFISPYSIHTALAMTYEGASGGTADGMESALNLPGDDDVRLPAFADLHEKLNLEREVELKTANALWPQENFPFYEDYLEAVKKHYLARIESLNYTPNPDAAVKKINEWAAEHTENKIKEILQDLDPMTRLVLTNAIYFKGTWLIPFDESLTEKEPFHPSDGSSVQVPMMQFHENRLEENQFYYSETSGTKALKLPYTGREMSMIFLLPKDESNGIDWLKEQGTSGEFEEIQKNFEKKQMRKIKIPKFEYKVRYQEELKSALKDFGMSSAFEPDSADFSAMSPLGENLFISKVVHKAYVKVEEKGTEAAAVTGVVMKVTAGPEKSSFVADRPFMFLIKDEKTGSILFIGSVVNPQSG